MNQSANKTQKSNIYHDEAYDLADRKQIHVGITKINTAFKTKQEIDNERAAMVLKMWKPHHSKPFSELKKMDTHHKKDYLEEILYEDVKIDAYLEN